MTLTVKDEVLDFTPLRQLDSLDRSRWIPQIVLALPGGPKKAIALPDGFTSEWLRGAIEKHDLSDGRVTDLAWPYDEEPTEPLLISSELARSIAGAIPTFDEDVRSGQITMHGLGKPVADPPRGTGEIAIKLGNFYPRALAKIGFHYLLKFDPFVSGREPEFGNLKNFISHGQGEPDDFVTMHCREFVVEPRQRKLAGIRHYAMVCSDRENRLQAFLRLFSRTGVGSSGPPIRISLGKDPFVRKLAFGHVMPVFERKDTIYDGEILELETGIFDDMTVLSDMREE